MDKPLFNERCDHCRGHAQFLRSPGVIKFRLLTECPKKSGPRFASAFFEILCKCESFFFVNIEKDIAFFFGFDFFSYRKHCLECLCHRRTISFFHPCGKCDQFFFGCFLTAADFLKRFDLCRIQLRFLGKTDHIASALMISIAKGNGYHHSYMDLTFQFLRNAILKTAVQFLMGNIYNDICIHH